MVRLFLDASPLIALANTGDLPILAGLGFSLHVTNEVARECAAGGQPASDALTTFIARSVTVVAEARAAATLQELGLGPGEASLFAAYIEGDVLVVDDRIARKLAQSRGMRHVGLLGLLVWAVEAGRLAPERGVEILGRLARADLRMTVALYDWARRRIEDTGRRR